MTGFAWWFGTLFTVGALALLHSGARQLVRGLRQSDAADAPIWLTRGLREVLIVVCGTGIALGYVFDIEALLMVSAVVLAEELYETGVALFILERGRAIDAVG